MKYLVAIILLLLPVISAAQDITLSWDASPTPEVTGYKVYYKQDNMILPFDGAGAAEGASPVDVGNVLTTTLTNLSDGATYYFYVTAYDISDNESGASNIVDNGDDADEHGYIRFGGWGRFRFWRPADGIENRGSAKF